MKGVVSMVYRWVSDLGWGGGGGGGLGEGADCCDRTDLWRECC